MPWFPLWVYAASLHTATPSAHLAVGLATAAAVLLAVVLAASLAASVLPAGGTAHGFPAATRRRRTGRVPRIADPDAAGRPRSRAPSMVPSAA
jgi:hypothetical protein